MKKLTRLPNWRHSLTTYINEIRHEPLVWGTHDCCIMAGEAVLAVTGESFIDNLKKSYTTPEQAFKIINRRYDAGNIRDLFGDRFEECHIAYARAGDLVYQHSNMYGFNIVVGICYGVHSFFINEDLTGLVELDTIILDGGFRVG